MPKNDDHYAYGIERAAVEAVMRFGAVKRWHMIETTGHQTLADHSACVAALAYLIVHSCPGAHFGSGHTILRRALFHDLPEVFTGDIPTPTKQWLARKELDAMEFSVVPAIFLGYADPDHDLLVKICDLADSIRYIRNRGVDMTAVHALAGLEKQFTAKLTGARAAWPAVVYSHVADITEFYAYETRKYFAGEDPSSDEGPMENDLARGPRNQPGSTGPVVRDAKLGPFNSTPVRDRVDGTKSRTNKGIRGSFTPKSSAPPPEIRSSTGSDPVD